MDHSVYSHDPQVDRVINNDHAWKNRSGYRTTSGYPCWDRSMNPCIPKHIGWGYDLNFWCLLCCFLCQSVDKTIVPDAEPTHADGPSTAEPPSQVEENTVAKSDEAEAEKLKPQNEEENKADQEAQ